VALGGMAKARGGRASAVGEPPTQQAGKRSGAFASLNTRSHSGSAVRGARCVWSSTFRRIALNQDACYQRVLSLGLLVVRTI
jgi:hypothetical protein